MSGERIAKLAKSTLGKVLNASAAVLFAKLGSELDPQQQVELATVGCGLLFGQTWLETNDADGEEKARAELRRLVEEYGSLGEVVEKIAEGGVAHTRVTRQLAQEIRRLRDLSEDQWAEAIEQAESTHGLIAYVANWTAKRFDVLSAALEEHDRRSKDGHALTHAELAEIKALVREALTPKNADDTVALKEYSPETIAAAKELAKRDAALDKARAALVLKDFETYRSILATIKPAAYDQAFEVATLEGDGLYAEGKFDEAVEPYETALRLAPSSFTALHNLAVALIWSHRLPRNETSRRAIDFLTTAIEHVAPHTTEWAMAQMNLGIAWRNLPTGDRDVNLRRATACFSAAIGVFTVMKYPLEWAAAQNNLGNTWCSRPTGDPRANARKAIEHYELTLAIYTQEAYPLARAKVLANLGNAWSEIPSGDHSGDIRKAIAYYRMTLRIYRRNTHSAEWAMTMLNLGATWTKLLEDPRETYVHKAIACLNAAIDVFKREHHPIEWAGAQMNLGEAHRSLSSLDRRSAFERSSAHYSNALQVFTRNDHPEDWATTQFDFGLAWLDFSQEDGARSLRQAITCFQNALTVFTQDAFPRRFESVRQCLYQAEDELLKLSCE